MLDGVSFAMQREEVVGLLGRNGAGKTTLINIAMGLLHPHSGSVNVFGMSPTDKPVQVKRRVGYVSEDQILPPDAYGADILAMHRKVFPTWDRGLEKQLMERFDLGGAKSRIRQLSKGQARQLALVCAVSHRPELLILDEPAGGLDPSARREFIETAIQLLNSEGTAILFSSHHMSDVERMGGRVVLLDEGRVLVDRDLDTLREEFCVAVMSRTSGPSKDMVERVPGCVRVRPVHDEWHAVFAGSPEEVELSIKERLGIPYVNCARVPLEEFFVELVGSDRVLSAQ